MGLLRRPTPGKRVEDGRSAGPTGRARFARIPRKPSCGYAAISTFRVEDAHVWPWRRSVSTETAMTVAESLIPNTRDRPLWPRCGRPPAFPTVNRVDRPVAG